MLQLVPGIEAAYFGYFGGEPLRKIQPTRTCDGFMILNQLSHHWPFHVMKVNWALLRPIFLAKKNLQTFIPSQPFTIIYIIYLIIHHLLVRWFI